MVLLAFSLQDQVEKYGAYVGIASFFGLALLCLLYFAQAREVKRLREWANTAPERANELEQAFAVLEQAERVRSAPAARRPMPVPVPQPLSPSVAPGNGAVHLKPEEVAALAFARSAGVREPHQPNPHTAPVAVAASPTEVATPAPAVNGGNGHAPSTPPPATPAARPRTVPAAATPAARRIDPPPPLPPRRIAAARRQPEPPPRRSSNMLALIATAIAGVLVLGVAVFLLTRGDDAPPEPPAVVASPTETPNTPDARDNATPTPTSTPAPTKETAAIAVYNGTSQALLAASQADLLEQDGFPSDNIHPDTAPPDQQRQTSVVMYSRGSKDVATEVAGSLGITDITQIDDATKAMIANSPKKWNVVVIVGADKMS